MPLQMNSKKGNNRWTRPCPTKPSAPEGWEPFRDNCLGKLLTMFSTHQLLQLWVHPKLATKPGSVIYVVLVLETRKLQDWGMSWFFLYGVRKPLRQHVAGSESPQGDHVVKLWSEAWVAVQTQTESWDICIEEWNLRKRWMQQTANCEELDIKP